LRAAPLTIIAIALLARLAVGLLAWPAVHAEFDLSRGSDDDADPARLSGVPGRSLHLRG
jgi:hypothetical protein